MLRYQNGNASAYGNCPRQLKGKAYHAQTVRFLRRSGGVLGRVQVQPE